MREDEIEIKNAIIERVWFCLDHGLMAFLQLDYGGVHQSFGGYCLYNPKSLPLRKDGNYCGHFIYRCLQIGGVDDWNKLVGKAIRVKATNDKIHAIGHIIKNDWFCPGEDFKE